MHALPSAPALLVLTTAPDAATADALAAVLIDARAAACVTRLAPAVSVYRWQGEVERADEIPLLIKTRADAYRRVEALIREHHPYALPEILALPVATGLDAYLGWIATETQPDGAASRDA